MRRVDAPEILDSDACSPAQVQSALRTLGRINRWFGGVATTQQMVERAAEASARKELSLLEVASGTGEVPAAVRDRVARLGISLTVTLLDRSISHLVRSNSGKDSSTRCVLAADGLALPFCDNAFDLVSCSLFSHHLTPDQLAVFVCEGLRVSRIGLLINDLVRHPLHLALVYASYPLMGSRVAWLDGVTSVRRAYTPKEIHTILSPCARTPAAPQIEISRHYLFRMGVIVWKKDPGAE